MAKALFDEALEEVQDNLYARLVSDMEAWNRGMLTRAEPLSWAKAQALDIVDDGRLAVAAVSLIIALGKHPELVVLSEEAQLMEGLRFVVERDADGVRRWIESFA